MRTVIKPLLKVPFESEPKKNKNTEKQEKKKHNCWEEQADLTLLHYQKTSQIIQKQNKKQNLILTIKLNKKKKEQAYLTQSGGGKEDEWQWGGG